MTGLQTCMRDFDLFGLACVRSVLKLRLNQKGCTIHIAYAIFHTVQLMTEVHL